MLAHAMPFPTAASPQAVVIVSAAAHQGSVIAVKDTPINNPLNAGKTDVNDSLSLHQQVSNKSD